MEEAATEKDIPPAPEVVSAMAATKSRTFDDVLADLGGLGRFQVMIHILLQFCELFSGWSLLMMAFAGSVPDFFCESSPPPSPPPPSSPSPPSAAGNDDINLNVCDVNSTSCSSYSFPGSDVVTAVTEWDLVCDLKYVPPMMISLQMGGTAVGCLLAGQISDVFGRKMSFYFFQLFLIASSGFAAFADSWELFAFFRFLIGVGRGFLQSTLGTYSVEFLTSKWRSSASFRPAFGIGLMFFALAAYLMKNMFHLHILLAALSVLPLYFVWFYIPESARWLIIKGKSKEARHVLERIASVNRKEMPKDVDAVMENMMRFENRCGHASKRYTLLDLFRNTYMVKISTFLWVPIFASSLALYGISFGVGSLSGSLYLNIFLLGVVDLPQCCGFYIYDKLGRKRSAILFTSLTSLFSIGCLLGLTFSSEERGGIAVTVMSIVASMFGQCAARSVEIWTVELYPTVVRVLGFGWITFAARVAGIVAPFVINLEDWPEVSFIVLISLLTGSMAFYFFLPETHMATLRNSIGEEAVRSLKEEKNKIVPAECRVSATERDPSCSVVN